MTVVAVDRDCQQRAAYRPVVLINVGLSYFTNDSWDRLIVRISIALNWNWKDAFTVRQIGGLYVR